MRWGKQTGKVQENFQGVVTSLVGGQRKDTSPEREAGTVWMKDTDSVRRIQGRSSSCTEPCRVALKPRLHPTNRESTVSLKRDGKQEGKLGDSFLPYNWRKVFSNYAQPKQEQFYWKHMDYMQSLFENPLCWLRFLTSWETVTLCNHKPTTKFLLKFRRLQEVFHKSLFLSWQNALVAIAFLGTESSS